MAVKVGATKDIRYGFSLKTMRKLSGVMQTRPFYIKFSVAYLQTYANSPTFAGRLFLA